MLLARVFGDLSPSKTLKLPVAIRTEEIYLEINIFRGVKYVITEINMSPIDHWGIVRTNFFSSARGNLQTFQIKCFSLIQRLILRYVGWNSASRLWDRLLQFSISLFLVTKFNSWTCLQNVHKWKTFSWKQTLHSGAIIRILRIFWLSKSDIANDRRISRSLLFPIHSQNKNSKNRSPST